MLINELPPTSRVWIFQANRPLTPDEQAVMATETQQFIESWTAHNQCLHASYFIKYNLFLILMVDESQAGASGCSIDKSVHFVKGLEKKFNLNFMNRLQIAYRDNDQIKIVSLQEFEALIAKGLINDETVVFNNLVQTKKELDEQWEVPLRKSWHKQLT
jgi:hypothetical protein